MRAAARETLDANADRALISRMIDDRDVWQAAVLIVKRYCDDAMLEAAERADQLLDECDMAVVWDIRRNWPKLYRPRVVA
jgi:hypothetical protein